MVVVTTSILVMPALFAVMLHLGRRSVSLLRGGLVVSEDRLLLLQPKLTRLKINILKHLAFFHIIIHLLSVFVLDTGNIAVKVVIHCYRTSLVSEMCFIENYLVIIIGFSWTSFMVLLSEGAF